MIKHQFRHVVVATKHSLGSKASHVADFTTDISVPDNSVVTPNECKQQLLKTVYMVRLWCADK